MLFVKRRAFTNKLKAQKLTIGLHEKKKRRINTKQILKLLIYKEIYIKYGGHNFASSNVAWKKAFM